jgi:TIR domain
MYSIASRRWFFPAVLALAFLVELLVSRIDWRIDTQSDAKLRRIQVRSGYELVLQQPASNSAQPILSYNGSARHNHRLTLDMHRARLSDESLRLLAVTNPPKTAGRLIYGPDSNEKANGVVGCVTALAVEFPAGSQMDRRSVQIAPRKPDDYLFEPSRTRLVHVLSRSPLAVRLSANSSEGADGPGCRNLLSIGSNWQQVVGKDLELTFLADPGSGIDLSLAVESGESSDHKVESLKIENLLPERLFIRPSGDHGAIVSRRRAGAPALTVADLRLGGDFLDLELAGAAGIPIPELLGWTKWPILLLLDLPLAALAILVFRLKKTIFISYAWADRDRVMPICDRLKQAGLPLWVDREQLRGGADWEGRIRREMLKCRRIIVFLSSSLNEGGFVLAEIALARAIAKDRFKRNAFLIPVRLERCPIPSILSPWNSIDLFEPDGESRLFEDLGVRNVPPAQEQPQRADGVYAEN